MGKQDGTGRTGKNLPLFLALALCMISVGIMVLAFSGVFPSARRAEFTPPPFEAEALEGTPALTQEDGYSVLDAQVYQTALCGRPEVRDGAVFLYLTNPESNSVWLKVRVLDENGEILGESGLLRPGEYVPSVRLGPVPESGASLQLQIMGYEPETYHSAGTVYLSVVIP